MSVRCLLWCVFYPHVYRARACAPRSVLARAGMAAVTAITWEVLQARTAAPCWPVTSSRRWSEWHLAAGAPLRPLWTSLRLVAVRTVWCEAERCVTPSTSPPTPALVAGRIIQPYKPAA